MNTARMMLCLSVIRNRLQRAEQRVGRGVATGQEHPGPTQHRAEEREERPGGGEGEPQGRGHARVVHDVGHCQHRRDGQQRHPQLRQHRLDDPDEAGRRQAERERRHERGQEARGAGPREPLEVVDRRVGRRLGRQRRHAHDHLVQPRHLDRQTDHVQHALDRRIAPREDEDDEQDVGNPSRDELAGGVGAMLPLRLDIALEPEDLRRLPHLHHQHHRHQGRDRGQNGRHLGPDRIAHQDQHAREGERAGRDGRQHLGRALEPRHNNDHVGRNDDGDQAAQPTGHGAQRVRREPGDVPQRSHRNAERPEGDRRGVGDQADERRVERREAEPGQHRRGHRHRRAEPGRALDEGAEREADEHGLQAAVIGESADGVLDDLELAGFQRHPVEDQRRDDDPADGKQPEGGAVDRRRGRLRDRHAVHADRQDQGGAEPAQAGHPARLALYAEQIEENAQRNGRDERRVGEAVGNRSVVMFPHAARL